MLHRRGAVAVGSLSAPAARGISIAGAGSRPDRAAIGALHRAAAGDASFLIAADEGTRCCRAFSAFIRPPSDFAGYSAGADYIEKEQSNDSSDTDL
jgi:hypothetical protein